MNVPKNRVLFTSMIGNEDMIDFMSNFRTRDHMHTDSLYSPEQRKKYDVQGQLHYFECNIHGEMTGKCFFIKNVPDKSVKRSEDSNRIKDKRSVRKSLSQLFTEEKDVVMLPNTNIKKQIPQKRGRMSKKDYYKDDARIHMRRKECGCSSDKDIKYIEGDFV